MKKSLLFFIITGCTMVVQSQSAKPAVSGWQNLDYAKDGYRGISLKEAYDLLKGRTSVPVIVGVIDSGIDTLQPDLKPVLWTNPKEIPYNKIDDDGNGLVDDYYGWNYLGAPDGENLAMSISEEYRTYYRFKKEFENKPDTEIPSNLQWQYQEWKRSKARLDAAYNKAMQQIENIRNNFEYVMVADTAMQELLQKKLFTKKDVDSLTPNAANRDIIAFWKNIFTQNPTTNEEFIKGFKTYKNGLEDDIIKLSKPPDNARDSFLKDDGYDITKTHYGNNNLTGVSGYHGTAVSSIIGAVRGNNIGIDGIADNVKIMMIRGILGKDEFDKDVALSIRYAVDHGAKVINMSFGKYISPDKRWVDEAIEYAWSKDVVVVHAAGNDASDNDSIGNYPSSRTIGGKYLPNLIQVGASGDESLGNVVAPFSNYGKNTVDVFAPGVQIECAIAGGGTQKASGTSLASPVVAGIAALLRSYFPNLKATEIVDILKKSGSDVKNKKVVKPGTENELVSLAQLCNTGKIINAAGCVKMAIEKIK